MHVESFGDCLTPGYYVVHSRLRQAAHFVDDQKLISLVDSTVGKGPNHIVAVVPDIGEVHSIEITNRIIQIDETACTRKEEREYLSRLKVHTLKSRKLQNNVHDLEQCMYDEAPENSFPSLIGKNRGKLEASQFNRLLAEKLASGRQALKRGAFETGVSTLIGAGYGLTPSGDDFVAGYCSGLYLGGARYTGLRKSLVKIIDPISERTNIVSRTMLRYCCRGRFYERAKFLLGALHSGNTREISEGASAMRAVGETSGTDFSFGLLCALQDFIV